MKLRNIALGGALVLLSVPAWAGTYFGGFEDTIGGDYDFNDIVFTITGATLVTSTGSYFADSPAALLASNDSGSPFWNNTSSDPDHAHDNIGYCVYGDATDSGTCERNGPYDVTAFYLALKSDGKSSVNDVTFFSAGAGQVLVGITADNDTLYWRNVDQPGSLHALGTGTTAITPDASGFVLVATAMVPGGATTTFTSNVTASDGESHFAFFSTTAPEPGTIALLGCGLVGIGVWRARRKA
jgi:hypothetical protein